MSARTTFLLMIVFLVLGYLAVFDPLKWKIQTEEKKEKEAKVFWLKDKKLQSIQLTTDKSRVKFECAGSDGCPFDINAKWNVIEPLLDNGDDSAIVSLARSILNLNSEDRVDLDNEPDPAEFGFNSNRGTLELVVKGEKEPYRLQLGKDTPTGGTTYAYTNRVAKRLFLIPTYFAENFKKDLFHWRNKRLFPAVDSEIIDRLSWKSAKEPNISFQKTDNSWFLQTPIEAPANYIHVEGLTSTLSYLTAAEVITGQKLGKPKLVIQFEGKGKKYSLRLFEDNEKKSVSQKLIAEVPGQKNLFRVDGTQFDRFLKSSSEYRNRTLLSADERDRVFQVLFRFPRDKKEITVKKEGAEWKRTAGDSAQETLSSDRIREFVDSLATSDIERFSNKEEDRQKFESLTADVELELKDAAGSLIHKNRFLVEARKEVWTESDRPKELRVITGRILKLLPIRLQDLLSSGNQKIVTSPGEGHDGKDILQHEHVH